MAEQKFTAKYEVDDGYAGGSRPQSFTIRAADILMNAESTDEEIRDEFYDMVEEEMRQRISACNVNADEFVQWVRSLPAEDEEA